MANKSGFYEEHIQQLILKKEHLFGDIGDSTVVFEKAIMQGRTICDCLIFTEKRGLIGIEIKTEHDSTQRLNKQLADYEKVCDYVYVLCHDNHIDKVDQILKRYKHKHVGILAYDEFRGEPLLGEYRVAVKSPVKDAYYMFDILWKEEILKLLGTFRHFGQKVYTATGVKYLTTQDRGGGVNGLYTTSAYSRKMPKRVLIVGLLERLKRDEEDEIDEASRVFCDIFIHHRQHPEKAIKYHHFFKEKINYEE